MRILRLDLLRFGPFTNQSLSFDEGQYGLHIVYGPNEAGKSSTLRALRQLLYGIPKASTDDFIHRHPDMRIGAVLESAAGERYEFVRRKGNTRTLLTPDGQGDFDADRLDQLLNGIDSATFERRFALDHATLVEGGREIASGEGDLGRSLFAAGAGVANVTALQKQLIERSELLFKPTGKNPELNKALAEYKAADKTIKQYTLTPAEWNLHDTALRDAEARREDVDRKLQAARREQNWLSRLAQAVPLIARWKAVLAELGSLEDVQRLPDDFPERRREALTQLDMATRQAEDAQRELERLAPLREAGDAPNVLLHHAADIAQLQEHLGSHRKAARDREQRILELRQLENDLESILRDLGRELERETPRHVTKAARRKIQELGNARGEIVQAVESAKRNLARLQRELERVRRQQPSPSALRDVSNLSRAIRRVTQQGDLEQRLTKAREELAQVRRQAEIGLKQLSLWQGTLAGFEQLAVPAPETCHRFEAEIEQAAADVNRLTGRRDQECVELSQLEKQIEQLRLQQDVPTEETLDAARRDRDRGWELVLHAWTRKANGDDEDTRQFIAQFAPRGTLAEAYRAGVDAADRLADRLRREAEQVATKARLLAERDQRLQRRLETESAIDVAMTRLGDVRQEWAALWQPLGINPLPPREMQRWLQQRTALLAVAETIRRQESEVHHLTTEFEAARCQLAAAMSELGQPVESEGEPLAERLERCREFEQQINQEAEKAKLLAREEQRFHEELEAAQQAADEAQVQWDRWQDDWGRAVQTIQLAADAPPSEANLVLNAIQELEEKRRDLDKLRTRIEGIDLDAARFQEETARLTAATAPDLAKLPFEEAAAALHQRLFEAERERTRRDEWESQYRHHQARFDEARREVEHCEDLLRRMCDEAHCESVADLTTAEERSTRKRDRERTRQDVEDRLHQLAGGLSLDDLADEATRVVAAEIAPRLESLQDEIDRLEAERDEANQTIGTEQTELRRMDGSSQAAEAQERIEHLLTQIRGHAEEYARLRLAAAVLQRAIDRYQESHQEPVLRRAGEIFRTLTGGVFEGLRADCNQQDRPVLVGVRAGGERTVDVQGMSEGTCDQLYLALRLASLEVSLNGREPLPFIVDDILIRFDDQRSLATLDVLAKLSRRTQVILFTHHEHLVDLAQRHLADDVLFVHRLDGPPAPVGRNGVAVE